VLIDKFAQKTALRLGVSSDAVRAEFKKAPQAHTSGPEAPEEPPPDTIQMQRPSAHEYWLLKLLFLHEELAGWVAENLDPIWIQHPLVRQIVSSRLGAHQKQTWQNLGTFLDGCAAPEMQNLITEAAAEQRAIPNPAQQLADVVLRLRNQFIDRQLQTLMQRANQPDANDDARVELLHQQNELRELKRRPIPPPA